MITISKHDAKISEILALSITKKFEEYVESRCQQCGWKECLDLLLEICVYNFHRRRPRTRELAEALSMTREKVLRCAKTMEPRYIKIYGCRVFVLFGSVRYFDHKRQEKESEMLLNELKEFLQNIAPYFLDSFLFEELKLLYNEIVTLKEKGGLYGAIRRYHDLIKTLNSKGIKHNLCNVEMEKEETDSILFGPVRHFDRGKQEEEFGILLDELRKFLTSVESNTVDPSLLTKLESLYNEIVTLKEKRDLYLYEAVRRYHDLIQILKEEAIQHNLRDAEVGRRSIIFILVGSEPCSGREKQEKEFDKLLSELKDFIQSFAPDEVTTELLETLNSQYEEITALRTRGDLYEAVGKYHDLIQTLDDEGIRRNLRDAEARKELGVILIGSEPCFGREKQEEEFGILLDELIKFLTSVESNTIDPSLLTKLESLYNDIVTLKEKGDLYKAVRRYHGLIQILKEEGIQHNLRDAELRSTSYRYALTSDGKVFC